MGDAIWRADLEAVEFRPHNHGGVCMIHRLAFRTLIGRSPDAAKCLVFFEDNKLAILRAAKLKMSTGKIADHRNFHLNSRDVRKFLSNEGEL